MTSYTLTTHWPPTVNTYYRSAGGKVLISASGRSYRASVAVSVMASRARGQLPRMPIAGRLSVRLDLYQADARKRDIDNLPKALLDSLTKARVWIDDSQIDQLFIVRHHITGSPHVGVSVSEIEEST